MSQSLIRPEVIAARRQHGLGEVHIGLPRLMVWWIGLMVASGLALLVLLVLGSYTRRVAAIGEIVPDAGLLRLDASATGVIDALYVAEGSAVRRGQTLLLIAVDQNSAAMGDTASLVARQLSAQAARVERSAQGAASDVERQDAALRRELASLAGERTLLQAQRALKTQQLELARQALARVAPLQQSGVMARRQLEEYGQAALVAEDALNEARLRIVEQDRRRRQLADQLAALPALALTSDTVLRGEQAALQRALAQAEAARVLRVVAPVDGVVTAIGVQPGQSVAADRRLLSIIPAGSSLIAELWVPGEAAARMAPGDPVRLCIDAFPCQRYGRVAATVEQVAATALGAQEIARIADHAPQAPAFRVRARLTATNTSLPLRAGMGIAGDVPIERRRLIQWLYGPLTSAWAATP